MAGRRSLLAAVVLAAALHAVGIGRSILPAQDGLKFLKIAAAFQSRPWFDVVRGTDQHPLYPALVALAEPVVSACVGRGPDAWRLAAQLVAAAAAVALLVPLHGLARELFGVRVADLTAIGFVLLPLPMAVGHDTLSDSLALFAFVLALRLGVAAIGSGRWEPAVGCGLAAGLGYLARPEVLVAPLAVLVTGGFRALAFLPSPLAGEGSGVRGPDTDGRPTGRRSVPVAMPKLAGLAVAFLAVVGTYALVKGEVSEKLAMRGAAAIGPSAKPHRKAGHWLPKGLDDPRWDFSPKEEPAEVPRRGAGEVAESLMLQWSEGLGGILAFFAVWGLVRDGHIRRIVAECGSRPDPGNVGRWVLAAYLALFTLVLIRHEMRMGYLSGRHTLTLVMVSLPWAAAGVFVCARGVAVKIQWGTRMSRRAGLVVLTVAVAAGVVFQFKQAHPTRWGHREAGRWLAAHAAPGEAVLDTRGWAAFVSGSPAYDYWHVRQAFTDAHLAYVVVGDDELKSGSRRAATLRAVLDFAGRPVADFPEREGGRAAGVRVFRFERPASWEGLRP